MAKCVNPFYEIEIGGGKKRIFSRPLLINFLHINKISSFDLLKKLTIQGRFSKIQEDVVNAIYEASKSLPMKPSESFEEDYEYDGDSITLCRYIDENKIPGWDGQPFILMKIDDADFKHYAVQKLINSNQYSTEEELNSAIADIKSTWKAARLDGKEMHELVKWAWSSLIFNNDSKFSLFEELLRVKFSSLYKKLKSKSTKGTDPVLQLFQTLLTLGIKINTILKKGQAGTFRGATKLSQHFKAITVDGQNLGCHIDQIYVDDDGRIYVFNFKLATNQSKNWSINKDTKYSYEMALIKKVLEANGIPVERKDQFGNTVNNIEMYNIPIVIKYNKDGSKIEGVNANEEPLISYNVRNNKAYLEKFELDVEDVIKPLEMTSKYMLDMVIDSDVFEATRFLQSINPIYDANAKGLKVAAKSWIREHIKSKDIDWDTEKELYFIRFDENTLVYVNSKDSPEYNLDILEEVQKHYDLLDGGSTVVVDELVQEITNNYNTRGSFENRRGFKFSAQYAEKTFAKYLNRNHDDEHDWQFIKNPILWKCGILLFRNRVTGLLDVIVPSAFQVHEPVPTKFGETNLLGYHTSNTQSPVRMTSTYGNMEIMRALSIINQIIDKLPPKSKLGEIKVITPYNGGKGISRSFLEVVPEFNKTIAFINKNTTEEPFKSNYNKGIMIDTSEVLYNIYQDVMSSSYLNSGLKHYIVGSLGLDTIESIKTKEARFLKFQEIMESIENTLGTSSYEDIKYKLELGNDSHKILAQIYMECVKAVNAYNGMYSPEVVKLNELQRIYLPLYANADTSVRFIANLYTRSLDLIASDFLLKYGLIRKKILDFYDKKGFTEAHSRVVGSAESLYSKFYEVVDGKKTWLFVNPYDRACPLDETEKDLLKYLLYQIHKVKEDSILDYKFPYSGPEDADLINKLKTDDKFRRDYLMVPLEKGSSLHLNRRSLNSRIQHKKNELLKLKLKGFKLYFKDLYNEKANGVGYDDGTSFKENLDKMEVQNPILASISGSKNTTRQNMLKLYEEDFFETNLEYIMADLVERSIAQKELKKVAFEGKALLFLMHALGDVEGADAKEILEQSIKEVEDYLKLNVFGKSLMEESSLAIEQFLSPAKRMIGHMFIAFNLRSAFRDSFEGVWLNMVRTLSHYQNDLKTTSVLQGYKKVVLDVFKSDRDMDIMSELCLRYRLSNTDVAKIAERAKTGRGGVFDPSYLGYATLRGPDFLNRMTLFTARCILDGVWDAFSLDENKVLKYDCTKDKRFEAYFKGNPKDDAYYKAKSAYYSAVRIYNEEHPNNTISLDWKSQPLPEPYSQNDIKLFKMFSDGIYGAYDKSLKAKMENIMWGRLLGMFSTWLNGKTAEYFRRPGLYYEYFLTEDQDGKPIIKKDSFSGNELWMDDNGNVIEKTLEGLFIDRETREVIEPEGEPVPINDRVPVEVQGIAYTLGKSLKIVLGGGSYQDFKERVLNNKYERQNIDKLKWDLLMVALFGSLFGFILTPMYKEHLKECDNVIENGLCELLYKSSAASYEGFTGIFAIGNYIVNDVLPTTPQVATKLIADSYKTLMGEKTFNSFLFSNAPVFRTFRETARLANPNSFRVNRS